jgi:hypothetical protein
MAQSRLFWGERISRMSHTRCGATRKDAPTSLRGALALRGRGAPACSIRFGPPQADRRASRIGSPGTAATRLARLATKLREK